MTQEMSAGERHHTHRADDDRDRYAIDGLHDDRVTADRLAEDRATTTGVAEDQDAAEELTEDRRTDRGWTDGDRLDGDRLDGDGLDGDGELQDGVRMHDEGRLDGSPDDERISPQSMLPHNQGEQDTGSHGNGTPHEAVVQDGTLFGRDDVDGFRARWIELQAGFVDEPRSAVQQADQLVAEVMQTMTSALSASRQQLEGQWHREGTADTEDLRQALRQYRSLFDKLLHV